MEPQLLTDPPTGMQPHKKRRLTWRTEYGDWWRAFRRASDETDRLGCCLVACMKQVAAPVSPFEICDIGCGDGRLLAGMARDLPHNWRVNLDRITLVDPMDWVQLASRRVGRAIGDVNVVSMKAHLANAGDRLHSSQLTTVGIMAHSAYDAEISDIERFVLHDRHWGTFVALDSMDSVFASAWREVNPTRYGKLRTLHDWMLSHGVRLATYRAALNVPARATTGAAQGKVRSFIAQRDFTALSASAQAKLTQAIDAHRVNAGAVDLANDVYLVRPSLT